MEKSFFYTRGPEPPGDELLFMYTMQGPEPNGDETSLLGPELIGDELL